MDPIRNIATERRRALETLRILRVQVDALIRGIDGNASTARIARDLVDLGETHRGAQEAVDHFLQAAEAAEDRGGRCVEVALGEVMPAADDDCDADLQWLSDRCAFEVAGG